MIGNHSNEIPLQRTSAQEHPLSPTDIARETLRRLAARRVAPTPDNYRQLYHEIAGHAANDTAEADGAAEQMLLELAAELPRGPVHASVEQIAGRIEQAVAEKNWEACKAALTALGELHAAAPPAAAPWAKLLKDILRHWETRHGKITLAKKRDGLERVLGKFGADPALLGVKLQALIESWTEPAAAEEKPFELVDAPATPAAVTAIATPSSATAATATANAEDIPAARLRQLIGQLLNATASASVNQNPDLAAEAKALAHQARTADDGEGTAQFAAALKAFLPRLEHSADHAPAMQKGLVRLLNLLLKSMRNLAIDDPWLDGEIETVEKLIASPLDARLIENTERGLKDLVLKQGVLRHGLVEVKNTLKNMVSHFIDRLGELSASTGDYYEKISGYAEQISRTEDVTELNYLLNEVMRETRLIQTRAQTSHDELITTRREVEAAQAKIRQLEGDLAHISEKLREDQLTGTLNRRGLDDSFEREAARADRHGLPLCLALLDVDDFKQLNDKYGHQTGDDALVHLTRIIRDTLRPDDIVARYGGEEFLILLPDTGLDEAVAVIVRLQRALTRQLFLHNNERMLITFSAGVAQRAAGENKDAVIGRADQALYQAKGAGKNRVIAAA
ncbi:MAG: diguanylate cyclase [Burkholderiales bacterium]